LYKGCNDVVGPGAKDNTFETPKNEGSLGDNILSESTKKNFTRGAANLIFNGGTSPSGFSPGKKRAGRVSGGGSGKRGKGGGYRRRTQDCSPESFHETREKGYYQISIDKA